jgi:hypothetical protein
MMGTELLTKTQPRGVNPGLQDRLAITVEEIWRTFILLTRLEDAFRDMKKYPPTRIRIALDNGGPSHI